MFQFDVMNLLSDWQAVSQSERTTYHGAFDVDAYDNPNPDQLNY